MLNCKVITEKRSFCVQAEEGQKVSDVLKKYVPSFALPCAGLHTCGKCHVRISGEVSPVSEAEKSLLSAEEMEKGIRLACDCTLLGNAEVMLSEDVKSKIIAWYETPDYEKTEDGYGFAVDIGTTTVAVQLIERKTGRVLAERLAENAQRGYGADVISRIEACSREGVEILSERIAGQIEEMAEVCLQEVQSAEAVFGGDYSERSYGNGTQTGAVVREGREEFNSNSCRSEMQTGTAVREGREEFSADSCRNETQTGVDGKYIEIAESVVTGNATMLHIYEGLSPASLAVSPFDVVSYFGCYSKRTLCGAPVYLPRCIGAYVGADIVCSILAAGVHVQESSHVGIQNSASTDGNGRLPADIGTNGNIRVSTDIGTDGNIRVSTDIGTDRNIQLLADIGTNGEMALFSEGKILCCSTAAGPAFEGVGLSHGMPAAPGAISKVRLEGDEVCYETIRGEEARGVCGSGILDTLAVMLEREILDESGYLEDPEDEDAQEWMVGDSGVSITQKDVRQIQLAKSAVCAGVLTLLDREGLSAEEIHRFVVAGGFGNTMNHASAARIGLFPAALQEKTVFIGNGALGGAVMMLCNREIRKDAEEMAKEAEEISLATCGVFSEYYMECMSF